MSTSGPSASTSGPSTSTACTLVGPVSAWLEADLRTFIGRHHLALWLDADGRYSTFVDRLQREPGRSFGVYAFRGSYLELMLALEGVAGGVALPDMVVHLPGFNEESIQATPLYGLYAAGRRYRKGFDTLLAEVAGGRVQPAQIAAFQGSLEEADAWLASLVALGSDGLAGQLKSMSALALVEDLLAGGSVARQVKDDPLAEAAVWARLAAVLDVTPEWRQQCGGGGREGLGFAAASRALVLEYVDDLARAPRSVQLQGVRALPRPVIEAGCEVARTLRAGPTTRDFYQRTADATQGLITEESVEAKAEDLGRIDTFRFEEEAVLRAGITHLNAGRFAQAATDAQLRLAQSFWVQVEPGRQAAWHLVALGAALGQSIEDAGQLGADGEVSAAVEAYVRRAVAVDRAHRELEQRGRELLYPNVAEFDSVRRVLDGLRARWRAWADGWAHDFNARCKTHGFLPPLGLQQRTLFDDVVRPLTHTGPVAFFVVDALRFELADGLRKAIEESQATQVRLDARLAELPTVTEVGMNVLAPLAQGGRLRPVWVDGEIRGFQAGEFRVDGPESRRRAMQDRVGGTSVWLPLEKAVSLEAASLKRLVGPAHLVVVHSEELDQAGEKGFGPAVFEQVLQKLLAAWRLLREAGIRRFVMTADHGFLLTDDRQTQARGLKGENHRRHLVTSTAVDHPGEVRVPFAALGYEGGQHLVMPDTVAVFEAQRRASGFVHGGNSLQERVIPVLTVIHRAPAGTDRLHYEVVVEARDAVLGVHRIEVEVKPTAVQDALDFVGRREVELALQVTEVPGIQVEVCQVGARGRQVGGGLIAPVGETIEVLFRLVGTVDVRVPVEVFHPLGKVDVAAASTAVRFQVTASSAKEVTREAAPAPVLKTAPTTWLEQVPEWVRPFFAQLANHGLVTEAEVFGLLGARAGRKLANDLDQLKKVAPFEVRIEVAGGMKRYLREGGRA